MSLLSYNSLESAIESIFGNEVHIVKESYVGGGDINNAFCLSLSNGERLFLKSNSIANRSFFDTEEEGIQAIRSTGVIDTPDLLCKGIDKERNISFLIMDMIESAKPVKDYWEIFGSELAQMHLSDTKGLVLDSVYGFKDDNYIGASKQINRPKESWIAFFRECRLEPQFKMAERYFDDGFIRNAISLMDKLDKILIEPVTPSLLHGDLWSGNIMTGSKGKAMLIDPAVYVGHAEADLAMTELFGSLPGAFYKAYEEVNPLQPGYKDRRDLYNLYHLLNHLNLFGSSYLYSVIHLIKKYI